MTQPTNYRTALELALDALKDAIKCLNSPFNSDLRLVFRNGLNAITAGRAALAQPQGEADKALRSIKQEAETGIVIGDEIGMRDALEQILKEADEYFGIATHPQASEPVPSTAARSCGDECDTPAYCKSVQRCTARDGKPAQGGREKVIAELRKALDSEFPREDIGLGWVERAIAMLQSTAQPERKPLTQEQVEELAHRRCKRYIHIDTEAPYQFDGHTLMDFVRDVSAHGIKGVES
jgi:hypothetical protein